MALPGNGPPRWRSSVTLATTILRTRPLRRQTMFVGMLLAMVQVFMGALPLEKFLSERPLLMAFYWLACLGLVLFVMLLAFYDLLVVRREEREKERSED